MHFQNDAGVLLMSVDKSSTLFHNLELTDQIVEHYEFCEEKNKLLIATRGIGFERVITALRSGRLLETINHHNQAKYPNQKFYVVDIDGYVCAVPFVEKDECTVFLKTIFKTRKLTKKHLRGSVDYGKENQETIRQHSQEKEGTI